MKSRSLWPYRAPNWRIVPSNVSVECPNCRSEAFFALAKMVRIRKREIPFFNNSKLFEYVIDKQHIYGYPHWAVRFHGLVVSRAITVDDIPEGYDPNLWNPTDYAAGRRHKLGTIVCPNCHLRRKHELDWPNDAYFQTELKGHRLWAYDRASLVELIE